MLLLLSWICHLWYYFFFFFLFVLIMFNHSLESILLWFSVLLGPLIGNKFIVIVYAHGRRLCSNWFWHGSTTISYPQCSLTFMRERYLHRCRKQSFAIRAYAMSAVDIDVVSVHTLFAYRVVSIASSDIVSSHTKYCRIAYGITRYQNALQGTNEWRASDSMAF